VNYRRSSIDVPKRSLLDVWHSHDVEKTDADRVIPLGWKVPFPAQWRMDWRQDDGLTDSWEMLVQKPDGNYTKLDWFGQSDTYGTPDWMKPDRLRGPEALTPCDTLGYLPGWDDLYRGRTLTCWNNEPFTAHLDYRITQNSTAEFSRTSAPASDRNPHSTRR
jgi:hypothetical protein